MSRSRSVAEESLMPEVIGAILGATVTAALLALAFVRWWNTA